MFTGELFHFRKYTTTPTGEFWVDFIFSAHNPLRLRNRARYRRGHAESGLLLRLVIMERCWRRSRVSTWQGSCQGSGAVLGAALAVAGRSFAGAVASHARSPDGSATRILTTMINTHVLIRGGRGMLHPLDGASWLRSLAPNSRARAHRQQARVRAALRQIGPRTCTADSRSKGRMPLSFGPP